MSFRAGFPILVIALLAVSLAILGPGAAQAQTDYSIITVLPPTGATVEEGEDSKVTVTLSHNGSAQGLLFFNTENGTATRGSDFGAPSSPEYSDTYNGIDLSANKTATITVPVVWDYDVEGDETFKVKLTLSTQAKHQGFRFPGNAETFDIPITITERSKYVVRFDGSAKRSATEGNNLEFKLNVEKTGRGTVAYKIRDDSDADTGDHTLAAGTLAINANSDAASSYTITVPTIDDALVEAPRESLILELSKVAGNPASFGNLEFPDRDGDGRPDTRLSFTGFIKDNEQPLWAEAPDVTVAEGGEAHVTLTLERALLAGEQVAFFANLNGDQFGGQACYFGQDDFAQPNADYPLSESAEYVIRGPGQSFILVAPTHQDRLDEADECFYARFVANHGVKFRPQSGQVDIGSDQFLWPKVTIADDDATPELHYGHPLVVETDYGKTAKLRYPVTLTAPSGLTVSVDYADGGGGVIKELNATSGTDYTAITAGTLTFKPGQVQKYVEVEVLGDWLEEPDERVYVRFNNPVNACLIPGGNCQGQLGAISIPGVIENDDRNLKITITPDDDRVPEGEDMVFRATLSHPIPYTLALTSGRLGGTATVGVDYDDAGLLFGAGMLIGPGDTEQTISVPILDDGVTGEGLETVTLQIDRVILGDGLSGGVGGADCGEIFGFPCSPDSVGIDFGMPTAYILDGPTLSILPAREKVSEGEPYDFRVALSEPASQDVTFTVKSEDGATDAADAGVAEDGADYTALTPQQVTIPAGQTDGGTYSIATHQDQADEPDHRFTLLLESVNVVQVDEGAVAAIIRDDDPRPTLSIADAAAAEGGVLEFAVTLSGATERTVTVRWVTEDDTAIQREDYHGGEHFHSVIFDPGETAKTIRVHSLPDTDPEPDETFRVQLADAPGARFQDATAVGTITNDDGVVIHIADAAPVTETEGATPQATFTITMAPAQATPVTVQWETMDGSGGQHDVAMSGGHKADGEADYTAVASASVTFAPGETVKQVSTTVLDDDRAEGEENFRAIITSVSDPNIKVMRAIAHAPIVDDDAWHIWIDESTPKWVDEGTGSNTVVTVKLKRTDASVEEGALDPRFHTEFEYIGCFVTTRHDDDWPFLRIPAEYGYYGNQPGDTDAHVRNDVGFRRSDGTDFSPECHERTESRGFVNEGFGRLEYEMSFELTVKGDAKAEENETFTFLLESTTFGSNRRLFDPVSGGWQYVTITIVDDETPQASIADASVVEDGGSVDLTVSLNKSHASSQSVHVSMVDGTAHAWSDYRPKFGYKVNFPAGATSATVNIPIVDDDLPEGSETFTVKLTTPSAGVNIHPAGEVATVTINDDAADSLPRLTVPDRVVEEGEAGDLVFRLHPPVPDVSAWASAIQWHDESPWPRAAATEGDDYAEITGNTTDAVAVAPGDAEVTAAVSTVEDTLIEGDEYIGVSITWNNPDLHKPKFDGREHGQEGGRLTLVAIRDDDPGSVAVAPIAAATVAENLTWTSPKPATPGHPFGDVAWAVEGDDAALFTIDFDTGLLTLPAQDFEDPADQDGDNVYEVTVRATDEDGNTDSQPLQVTVTNIDEVLPVLTIGDASVAEGGMAEFTLTLSKSWELPVTVEWTTGDDPAQNAHQATADADYTAVTTAQTASIPAGDTTVAIEVQTTADTLDEEDETFVVILASPTNATLGAPSTGTGTITDDDALPVLTIGDARVAEGGNAEFTVTLDAASGREVTVQWTTGDDPADGAAQATANADYTAVITAKTATIAAGATTATIEVQTTQDTAAEEDETFVVTLASPVNATLGDPSTGAGTITNDDATPTTATLSVSPSSVGEAAGATTVTVTATLGGTTTFPEAKAVRVNVGKAGDGAVSGTDYAAVNELTLIILAQTRSATGIFTLAPTNDALDEDDETVTVHATATGLTISDASVTITDDDATPSVTIGDASVAEGGKAEFTVTLSAASGREVTVQWTTGGDPADGAAQATADTDYTAFTTAQTATIAAGATTATIEVQTTQDTVVEADETFVVALASPANATLGSPSTGTGTITDDDALPVLTIGDASIAEGSRAEFTVTLSKVWAQPVTVQWTTGDDPATNANQARADADYTAVTTAQTATIAAGDTTAAIEIQTTQDSVAEGAETFVVSLASPTNATLGDPSTGTGTITDDDTAPTTATLSVSPSSVGEAAGSTTVTVTATLGGTTTFAEAKTVRVSVGKAGDPAVSGTDYTAVTSFDLTITAEQSSGTQDFTLTPTNDALDEDDEAVTVHATSTGLTISDASVTITDDDALPVLTIGDAGADEAEVAEFTVTLSAVSGRAVTVQWTTGDDPATNANQATADTDYTAVTTAQTATIAAGATTATVEVQTTPDNVEEGDETFVVILASPANAALGSPSTGTGTITDDDKVTGVPTEVTGPDALDSPLEVPEDVETAPTFSVTVSPEGGTYPTAQTVTVSVGKAGDSAVSGTDYTAVGDLTLILTAGAGSVTGQFTLDPIDDALDEPDETVTITSRIGGAVVSEATLTITDDDDPPTVSVGDAADVAEGDDPDATTDMTFTITLSAASGRTVSVPYTLGGTAASGSDYTRPNPLATEIAPGDTTGNIVIPVRGDTVDENDETVEVTLGMPRNATLGSPSMATGIITDDDEFDVPLVSFASTHYTVTEGDTRHIINVVVNASPEPDADLSVAYTIAGTATNGTDYAQLASPVTVPVSGTANIAITVTDDMMDDDGETIILTLIDGNGFNLGTTHATTITIADDDGANNLPLVNLTAAYAAAEPVWTSSPSWTYFQVTLSQPLNQDVWIPIDLDFMSAEESECVHWNGAERCGAEVMPGSAMVGPQYEGISVSDCSAKLPRDSIWCLPYPYASTDEIDEWWDEVADGNFIDYQRPYLLPIKAGRTSWQGAFGIRKDTDELNEKFKIILAMDTEEWPGNLVQPGDNTEAEVFVVDIALGPTAGNWWAELSADERRQLLSTDGMADSSPITRQLSQSQHLTGQYVPNDYGDTHPRLATVIGSLAGELVDAEMDADDKRVDLSSSQLWWDGLDCRLRRTAVGEGVSADPASEWCQNWAALSSVQQIRVDNGFGSVTATGGDIVEEPTQDSEAPGPEISIASSFDVTEGGIATFMLTAIPAPLADLDVSVSVSQTGDFGVTAGPQTVTIPTSGVAFLDVTTVDDSVNEADGSITLTVTDGTYYDVSASAGSATVAVEDDDACVPQLPSDAVTVSEVTGWRDEYTQDSHVSRWNRVLEALGEDTNSGESPMSAEQARDIKSRIDNSRWDRTVRTLEALEQCANPPAATPEISIAADGDTTEGSDATFTLTASPAPSNSLDVTVSVTASGDYGVTAASHTVSIGTGGTGTLTVTTSGDSVDEADGSVTATIDDGTNYDVSATAGAATVAVSDDDVPEISIAADGDITEGGNATFTVSANPAPHAPLDVSVGVTQSGDFGVTPGSQTVTIPTTGTGTLTVSTDDDSVDEADGSVTATVNSGSGYTVSATAGTGTVAVADDDATACTPNLPLDAVTVSEVTGWRDGHSGAAHVLRWNRVLEALGEDTGTGATAMTVTESEANENTFMASRWDRVTRTLEAIEACDDGGTTTTVVPPPPTPEVSIAADGDVTEGGSATFTVTANPAPTADLDVAVSVAQTGDYGVTPGSRTVTIGTGGSGTLTVTTDDDSADEPDGSVTATITAGTDYDVSATAGAATAVVSDDDDAKPPACTPNLPSDAVTVSEVTGWRDAHDHDTAHVLRWNRVLEALGEDTGTGATAMTAAESEANESTFMFSRWDRVTRTLEAIEACDTTTTTVVPPPPTPEVSIASDGDITEGGDATFTLTANPAPSSALTVTVTVTQSGNFGVTPGSRTVTISTGGTGTLTLTTDDDSVDEADGSVTATVDSGTDYTVSTTAGAATVAVSDDDDAPPPPATPEISIAPDGDITEGGAAIFTLTANPTPTSALTVTVSVAQSGDYGVTPGSHTVTISTGGTGTLTVTTDDDSVDEADGSVAATVDGGQGYAVSTSDGAATLTVLDDDATTVTLAAEDGQGNALDVNNLAIAEDGGVMEITLTLNRPLVEGETLIVPLTALGATVDDHYTLALRADPDLAEAVTRLDVGQEEDDTLPDTGEHSVQNPAVVFLAGSEGATLLLTALDNGDAVERTVTVSFGSGEREPVGVSLHGGVSAEGGPLAVAITNDDVTAPVANPTISSSDASAREDAGTMEFTVSLSGASTKVIKVRYSVGLGTAYRGRDFVGVYAELVFQPGETSKTVTIVLIDDDLVEGDETFGFWLSYARGGATIPDNHSEGTIIDDD